MATNETHEVEINDESGSVMHMFVRNGTVKLSEENTEDGELNRAEAWIEADECDLVEVQE